MTVFGGHASGVAVVAVVLTITVVALLATALRLFTRLQIARNGGYDDTFICIAAIASIGLTVCTCLEIYYGLGRHQRTITPAHELGYLKTLYASILLYQIGLFCAKQSILFQYLRIFPQKRFRIACYALMTVIFVYTSWCFWSQIFFCKPMSGYWDMSISAKCMNREAVWFANAAVNILTDIATALLPLPMLKQLNMQRRPKMALMIVFILGGFTCVVSILRLQSIYAAAHSVNDLSYNSSLAAMWSSLEVNTGILCSCLPTLRALVTKLFPRFFPTHHRSHPSRGIDNAVMYGSGRKVRITHEEFSHDLTGRNHSTQHAFASRGSRSSAELRLEDVASSPKEIKVVTVVHQQIERAGDEGNRSEQGSTRDLIYRTSSSD